MAPARTGRASMMKRQHQFLQIAGDPPLKWTIGYRNFYHPPIAIGKDSGNDARKRTLIRSSLGLKAIEFVLSCVDIEIVCRYISKTQRVAAKKSSIYAWEKFNRRTQSSDVRGLRGVNRNRNYEHEIFNDLLSDRFVIVSSNNRLLLVLLLRHDQNTRTGNHKWSIILESKRWFVNCRSMLFKWFLSSVGCKEELQTLMTNSIEKDTNEKHFDKKPEQRNRVHQYLANNL